MTRQLTRRRSRLILYRGARDRRVKGPVATRDGVEARVIEKLKDFEIFEFALRRVVGGDGVEDGAGSLGSHEIEFVGGSGRKEGISFEMR